MATDPPVRRRPRRRSHRPRRPPARRATARTDLPPGTDPLEHHPYTVEGQIEQVGLLARGANRATGRRRVVARALIGAPVWVTLAVVAVLSVTSLVRWLF